ncbi:MAG: hypothetical protein HQL38_03120 [Alphaproteobacteria bacterium]|nr:hypothetical protein [Alphaproteobacteria bacterium]
MPTTDVTSAGLDRILAIRAEGRDPEQVASETRAIVQAAMIRSMHDRLEWMEWAVDTAVVSDGCHYLAALEDGRTNVEVVAIVYAADEVGFCEPGSPEELDVIPTRLKWLGF